MDLKVLGCACLSLGCVSFLVFDYLSYSDAPSVSAALPVSIEDSGANSKVALNERQPVIEPETLNTKAATQSAPQPPAAKVTPRFKTFTHPQVAGFLRPDGFNRPQWVPQTNGLAVSRTPLETQRFVVMLDPGHGGSDPGAKSFNGLLEKHLTLDIAKRVRRDLSKYPNIEVLFTRETDKGLSRDSRIQEIKSSRADLLISLHFNDLPQTEVALVETFFAGRKNIKESLAKLQEEGVAQKRFDAAKPKTSHSFSFTDSSQRLASILQQHVYTEVSSINSNVENAGVKNDTLFVLTRTDKTSALIELTCLTNPAEATRLATQEYRNRLSKALADGILEYRESTLNKPLIDPGETVNPSNIVRTLPASNNTNAETEQSV